MACLYSLLISLKPAAHSALGLCTVCPAPRDSVFHLMVLTDLLRFNVRDFPGGPVVKNPPCDAGDASRIPRLGTKIPSAAELTKPACHNWRLCAAMIDLHGAVKTEYHN